ncbi:hypothetical protein P691DRAFT_684715 [Macrolepiota fuliginosa MF-IS2]|uniref:Uncharacterized protein n=1 Tax=Macrolepiota fuliginosa MF-IS2 TaxID=1400762 RepID=A0A9P6BX64_9AGAR|nr:hypothetical protein P691DRAFT_684715 [Macrolepiota fuliginosa MF-IS2]
MLIVYAQFINLLNPPSFWPNSLVRGRDCVQITRVKYPTYQDRIVLVEFPGFGGEFKSDRNVLETISDWLRKTYQRGVKLSGIVYLHRIIDHSMAGLPLKNLQMFKALCGDAAMDRVFIVSTMWQKVRPEVGVAREHELRSRFWVSLIRKKAMVTRLGRDSPAEAWSIIEHFIRMKGERKPMLIQEQLVEPNLSVHSTTASNLLYNMHRRDAHAQLEECDDCSPMESLNQEYQRIEPEEANWRKISCERSALEQRARAVGFVLNAAGLLVTLLSGNYPPYIA